MKQFKGTPGEWDSSEKHIRHFSEAMIGKCPHCDNDIKYPEYAYENVGRNHKACTVATTCCGKPVTLRVFFRVGAMRAETFGETDDWGTPYASE